MSIRLDPRRVGLLKQLAADANQRPGDLVRQWVEERIDAQRHGGTDVAPVGGVATRLNELAARIAALEAAAGLTQATASGAEDDPQHADVTDTAAPAVDAAEASDSVEAEVQTDDSETPAPAPEPAALELSDTALERRTRPATGKRVSAAPSERVALHDEMIAVLSESGPMSAAELAAAVTARGRYAPPRSGKPVDAAMVSQRVSNPTYRSRFTRNQGRIGLAEGPAES